MNRSSIAIASETDTIGIGQFIPKLLGFLGKLPSISKVVKQLKKMKPGTRESLGTVVERNAIQFADQPAVFFEDEVYTYQDLNRISNQYANYFLDQGIKKGDVIVVLLDNRPDLIFCLSGLAKIGAVSSMINPNLRGTVLAHCVTIEPAEGYIIDEELVDAFEEIRSDIEIKPGARICFSTNCGNRSAPEGYIDLAEEMKTASDSNPATTSTVEVQNPLCYIFTSGTTGKPKAAIIEHHRWLSACYGFGTIMGLTPSDRVYIPLPFSHSTALLVVWGPAMHSGSAIAIRRKFSASSFWKDVKKYGITAFGYIGELCRYLMNQPPQVDDRDNNVKMIIGNGLRPDIWKAFKERFGIRVIYEFYSSSEGNVTFANMMNLDCTIGFGFSPYAIVRYDIEADEPIRDNRGLMQKVKKGEAGLLLGGITEDNRFVGYTSSTETERKTFRDVFKKGDAWFNTGDLIRSIGYGQFQFVDRVGDTFRWKGENVSTTEVEEVISTQEQVLESTVYGVTIPGTEGRAGMVSIIADTNPANFDFKSFSAALQKALPAYAVPVFVRFQEQFETTPTMKRIKSRLKQGGFNPEEVNDPLFVLLPGQSVYTPLTQEHYQEIINGKHRF